MKRLRAETQEQHEALERVVQLGGVGLSLASYAATLRSFAGFYRTWEGEALASAPDRLRPLVEGRRKLALLEADLERLGERGQSGPVMDARWLPDLGSEAGLLGSMYVVEGSTLGGQLISRQVERELGLVEGQGYSFFRSYGQDVGRRWKEFGALVEAMPEPEAEPMVDAARQTFAAFHRWVAGEWRE